MIFGRESRRLSTDQRSRIRNDRAKHLERSQPLARARSALPPEGESQQALPPLLLAIQRDHDNARSCDCIRLEVALLFYFPHRRTAFRYERHVDATLFQRQVATQRKRTLTSASADRAIGHRMNDLAHHAWQGFAVQIAGRDPAIVTVITQLAVVDRLPPSRLRVRDGNA